MSHRDLKGGILRALCFKFNHPVFFPSSKTARARYSVRYYLEELIKISFDPGLKPGSTARIVAGLGFPTIG